MNKKDIKRIFDNKILSLLTVGITFYVASSLYFKWDGYYYKTDMCSVGGIRALATDAYYYMMIYFLWVCFLSTSM